jgi:Ca2+-binding RTX toxin-like protein
MTLTGTGLATDAFGNIVGGTITSIKVANLPPAGAATYYTMAFSPALGAATLWSAILQFYNSGWTNSGLLDSIFRGQSYTFTGGSGDDFFEGSNTDDIINGNAGDDVLLGFEGHDTINGGDGDDYIDGFGGNNTINGGKGDDRIVTGTGINTIIGGAGADYIDGRYSISDTVSFSTSSAAVKIDLRFGDDAGDGVGAGGEAEGDVYVQVERFIGSKGGDTFYAATDDTTLPITYEGGGGNDTFYASTAVNNPVATGNTAALFVGGDGIDTYIFAASEFRTLTLDLQLGTAERKTSFEGKATDTLSGIENATGGAGDDTLTGSFVANVLDGGDGDDLIRGAGGADILKGGNGVDVVSYKESAAGVAVNLSLKTAQISAGTEAHGDILSGFEQLWGSDLGGDTLTGSTADDVLAGLGGNDILAGGSGADKLYGDAGIDTVSYAGSNAAVTVYLDFTYASGGHAEGDELSSFENAIGSAWNDSIEGSADANKLEGNGGNDLLLGESGDDELYGGAGNDWLLGGVDNDDLFGDAGNDTLDGGSGADVLTGGIGRDVFVYSDGGGGDVIQDFVAGSKGDYLDLRGISNLVFYQQLLAGGVISQNLTNTIIDLSSFTGIGTDKITLTNVNVGQFRPINFILN